MLEKIFGGQRKKRKHITAASIRAENIADERTLARIRENEEKLRSAIIWELNILINDILDGYEIVNELMIGADLFASDMKILAKLMKAGFLHISQSYEPLTLDFPNQESDSLLQLYNDLLTRGQSHQTILDVLSQGITIKYSATRRDYVNDIEYFPHTYELIGLVQLVDSRIKYSIRYCHNGIIQQSMESFDRTEISRFIATARSRNDLNLHLLWRD